MCFFKPNHWFIRHFTVFIFQRTSSLRFDVSFKVSNVTLCLTLFNVMTLRDFPLVKIHSVLSVGACPQPLSLSLSQFDFFSTNYCDDCKVLAILQILSDRLSKKKRVRAFVRACMCDISPLKVKMYMYTIMCGHRLNSLPFNSIYFCFC